MRSHGKWNLAWRGVIIAEDHSLFWNVYQVRENIKRSQKKDPLDPS